MFANSSQSRIEGYSEFPPTAEVEQNSYHRNNNESELLFSRDSVQQLMEINEQALVIKIGKLIHELVQSKEKVFLYEDLCKKLRRENESMQEEIKYLKQTVLNRNKQFQEKSKILSEKQQAQNKLKKQNIELMNQVKILQQKLVEPKTPPVNLQGLTKMKKKIKEYAKINELLQKQLRIANSKVIQLQKSMQEKACSIFVGQLHRLKQNSIKSSMLYGQNSPYRAKQSGYESPMVGLQPYNRLRAYSTKNYRV